LERRLFLSSDPFLETSGTTIRDGHGTGNTVLLQGTNIGSFLLTENWSTPRDSSGTLPDDYSERQELINRFGQTTADTLITNESNAWITTADLDHIKALGMNVIRLPFWYRNLQNEDGTWRSDAFTQIDWLVQNAWARGIYTILDFHGVWGGQSTSQDTGEVRSSAQFWSSSTDQTNTINDWTTIAQHFAGNPAIAGYDLINEPWGAPSNSALWTMYNRMYTAIRAVDPNHIIMMEAQPGNDTWDTLPAPSTYGWTNVVYQLHEYQFSNESSQSAVEAGINNQVADFKAHLSWNVPCMIGEFNEFGWTGWTPVWNYAIQQFQQNGMSWSEWEYKADAGSAPNSWGIYDPVASPPPTPNLVTDSAATIANDWSQWTTANAFSLNTMLEPALNVTTRNNFNADDIGSPAVRGTAAYDNTAGQWTVIGAGTDIANGSDQFQFTSQPTTGDMTLVTRVTSLQNTSAAANAGLMFRDSTAAGAPMADVALTAGNGLIFQWRTVTGGTVSSTTIAGIAAGVWLKLVRTGSSFAAFYSSDGNTWTQVGTAHTIAMATTARAGLAVSSHSASAAITATFTNFSITPTGWSDADIGSPTLPGSAIFNGQSWIDAASGSDIWGTADELNFVSHPLVGDGSISAQINTMQTTDPSAKSGVMIRESTAAGSRFADVFTLPGGNVYFQWRTSTNGGCGSAQVNGITAPVWVKVSRTGNSFAGYYSTDGVTWNQIGSSITIGMNSSALAGMALVSHTNTLINTSTVRNVSLSAAPPTIASAAAASPATVTATSTALSVLASDPTGESNLLYTWSEVSGPAAVTFSDNGTNTADQTTATFTAAGTYVLSVSASYFAGSASASSNVTVTVNQPPISISVTPASSSVNETSDTQVSAVELDQFGNPLTPQPAFNRSVTNGLGSIIPSSGLYLAPSGGAAGTATIQAAANGITGSASVSVTPLLADGSFESPALTAGTYTYNVSGTPWTFTGNSGIESNGSAWNATAAPDGTQAAFLQGDITAASKALGVASEQIAFAAGTYTLNFEAARRSSHVQPIQVSVDGTQVALITPASSAWTAYTTAPFTLAAGTHTISFAATNTSGDNSSFIDAVGINLASPSWLGSSSDAAWNPTARVLTVTGPTSIIADPGTDLPAIVAVGSAAVVAINPTTGTQVHLGGLSLTGSASASVTSLGAARSATNYRLLVIGAPGATTAPMFTIDSTSTLDLADNDMAILYGTGTSPLPQVQEALQSAYDAGKWDKLGLTSSVAPSTHGATALGYATSAELGATTFDGLSMGGNAVLVKYTLVGDTTLSGTVSGSDYNTVLSNFDVPGDWSQGNFFYTGKYSNNTFANGMTDGSDYNAVLSSFDASLASYLPAVAVPAFSPAATSAASAPVSPPSKVPTTATNQPAVLPHSASKPAKHRSRSSYRFHSATVRF
jgi:regulation of enolase protein 1 (concanavalin A-like superfamily)